MAMVDGATKERKGVFLQQTLSNVKKRKIASR
jgi:hypothetical protein